MNSRLARELLRIAEEVKILDVPDTRQTYTYDCGAKATQSVLAYYGIDVREDKIMKALGTSEEGTDIKKIVNFLKENGLGVKEGQLKIETLKEAVRKGWPVIMPIQAWTDDLLKVDWVNDKEDGHYVICIGYKNGNIIFEDPAAFEKAFLPEEELEDRWHDFDAKGKKYDHYGLIVTGKPEYSSEKIKHMD